MWVSLGRRCEVTWQIRHHVGQTRTYPFDWLITPLQAVVPLIESKFERIADPTLLEVSPAFHPYKPELRGETVINTRYGVCLHHEFERASDRRIAADWREHIGQVQDKFRHLVATWDELLASGERIDLIRQGGRMRMPEEVELATRSSDLDDVLDVVRRRATGPVSLTLVDCEPTGSAARIQLASIGRPSAEDWPSIDEYWQGSVRSWAHVFRTGMNTPAV